MSPLPKDNKLHGVQCDRARSANVFCSAIAQTDILRRIPRQNNTLICAFQNLRCTADFDVWRNCTRQNIEVFQCQDAPHKRRWYTVYVTLPKFSDCSSRLGMASQSTQFRGVKYRSSTVWLGSDPFTSSATHTHYIDVLPLCQPHIVTQSGFACTLLLLLLDKVGKPKAKWHRAYTQRVCSHTAAPLT